MDTKIQARSYMRGPAGKAFTYEDFTPEQLEGLKGADGVSPTITIMTITGGHRIIITDKNGTKYFDVMDGKDGSGGSDGSNGDNGEDGADGFSPIVEVTPINNGHRVSITDINGSKIFDVMNGEDGYTPVKGTDYFTETEIAEIAKQAAELVDVPESGTGDAVLYTEQTLTDAQQLQARTNIGAVSVTEFEAALGEVDAALSSMDEVIG